MPVGQPKIKDHAVVRLFVHRGYRFADALAPIHMPAARRQLTDDRVPDERVVLYEEYLQLLPLRCAPRRSANHAEYFTGMLTLT